MIASLLSTEVECHAESSSHVLRRPSQCQNAAVEVMEVGCYISKYRTFNTSIGPTETTDPCIIYMLADDDIIRDLELMGLDAF